MFDYYPVVEAAGVEIGVAEVVEEIDIVGIVVENVVIAGDLFGVMASAWVSGITASTRLNYLLVVDL